MTQCVAGVAKYVLVCMYTHMPGPVHVRACACVCACVGRVVGAVSACLGKCGNVQRKLADASIYISSKKLTSPNVQCN